MFVFLLVVGAGAAAPGGQGLRALEPATAAQKRICDEIRGSLVLAAAAMEEPSHVMGSTNGRVGLLHEQHVR